MWVSAGISAALAVFALWALCGCAPSREFYEASRAFYDVVAPEYGAYVEADEGLSEERKEDRRRRLRARRVALDAEERRLEEGR